jgi:hypothetical protein
MSAGYEVKTYVVQAEDGRLIGVKLTREAAQAIAKLHAPARVTMIVADKIVATHFDISSGGAR